MDESPEEYLLKPRTKRDRLAHADRTIEEAVRQAEETGELRHLHGKPLDLSDDTPDWFVKRTLKEAGFTHPALERGQEVDELATQVHAPIERLRQRRDRLSTRPAGPSPEEVETFNTVRCYDLDRYRERLAELNRAIRDYNLSVADALHKRPYDIDRTLQRVAAEIPELEPPAPPAKPDRRRWWRRPGP